LDISINIAGIHFTNPIILASGPLSNSKDALLRAGVMGFGGIVTKSATMAPSSGNPQPHLVIRKGYVINADGIHNQGYKAMAKDILDAKNHGLHVSVIASVAGASLEDFIVMSKEFERKKADGIELNFVCPNRGVLVGKAQEESLGRYWVETAERSYPVIKAVKKAVKIPVWAKIPFETVYKDHEILRKMEQAGVDAVTVTTSMPKAMAINLETRKPLLGNPRGAGAVGGLAMKPLGVYCVSELSRIVKIPVIASGGVFSGLDVIEYFMVGAQAVAVLTAILQKYPVVTMLKEIEDFLSQNGYNSLNDIRGKTLKFLPAVPK
jgi:dihydroorotate dehydrogenase (NAD+) catalytic subunit